MFSVHIAKFLSCTFSAPALSSIALRYLFKTEVDVLNPLWTYVDKWLAWLTTRIQGSSVAVVGGEYGVGRVFDRVSESKFEVEVGACS